MDFGGGGAVLVVEEDGCMNGSMGGAVLVVEEGGRMNGSKGGAGQRGFSGSWKWRKGGD